MTLIVYNVKDAAKTGHIKNFSDILLHILDSYFAAYETSILTNVK